VSNDDLGPVRGCLWGLLWSLPLWVVIIVLVWVIVR